MSTYRHVADSAPYYDDYVGAQHEDKGYLKVLWKPSRAVQARELTQMQTYAQKQIAELGGYLFKDGTVVHGGVISTTTKQKYFIAALVYPTGLSLEDAMAGFMSYSKDKASIGTDGVFTDISRIHPGISFQIVGWETYDEPEQVTIDNPLTGMSTTMMVVFYNLFGGTFADSSSVQEGYVSSDTKEDALRMVFESGTNNDVVLKVTHFFNEKPSSRDDIYLTCTRAFCSKGTIFVDGYFVNCPYGSVLVNQIDISTIDSVPTIRLKEIDDDEEYHIGFWISRSIVTSYEDSTLSDPASGTYNHKSSGADRYSMLANLICLNPARMSALDAAGLLRLSSSSDTAQNDGATEGIKFVTGIVMRNNIVIKEQSNIGMNAELMDEIARRTYEESGNYTVTPWKVQIENCTSTDDKFERDVPSKYEISVNPGLGYIYGYRVSTCVSQKIINDRARTKMVRPVSTKYTENSLNVLTADLYTPNNASSAAASTWNINSRYINRIFQSARVVLVDRQIGELIKTFKIDTQDPVSTIPTEADYNNWLGRGEIHELGTASVSSIVSEDNKSLRIWLLDIENVSNLSAVSAIICKPNTEIEEGAEVQNLCYIDLLHQGENNITVWNCVEEPLIFETNWLSVAPSKSTYAAFTTENSISASNVLVNDGITTLTFTPNGSIGVPTSLDEINYVINTKTGETISPSKFELGNSTENAAAGQFAITETVSGTFTSSDARSYLLSYQGLSIVSETMEQHLQGINAPVNGFKKKTLTIGTHTVTANELSELRGAYKGENPDSSKDIIHLFDDNFKNLIGTNRIPVTDLVKILAIESKGDTISEYYWNKASSMPETIVIDDGCKDYCYQQASITGIGKWFNDENKTDNSIQLTITFAYWRHSNAESSGFYYAGSYETDESVQFNSLQELKSIEKLEIDDATGISKYKRRLAEWYNVNSIMPASSEESDNGIYDENAWRLIPKYTSKSGASYDLANCFDFRPDWISDTHLTPVIPLPSTLITYQVSTYLPRIDCVWVDKEGMFGVSKGTPSDNPMPPKTKDGTLVLYNIYNKPYGKTLGDIVPEYIDNRRHTMVDITALANRLANLEEVVSMSMSEQSAANMQIVDDDGISRYKCGIFTDSFGSFDNCNYSSNEWSATIDTVENCIRPKFDIENWGFSPLGRYVIEGQNTYSLKNPYLMDNINEGNASGQVQFGVYGRHKIDDETEVGGTVLTILPLVNEEFFNEDYPDDPVKYRWLYAKNDAVTETTNVQSVMFVVWNGNLTLTPAIDTWTNDRGEIVTETWEDTERPPDSYRSWTTKTDGTITQSNVKQTVPSGMTYKDLDKLYGKSWREVPKAERITHLPGWWEPATTMTEVATYKTVTATKVTEKTTYTGSWQANDVSMYMESQDEYMRVRKVKFDIQGLRPNQTFRAYMDKVPLKLLNIQMFNDANNTETLDEIDTNPDGSISGYFIVPDKMPVGTKIVEFCDGEGTSAAMAEYTASGKTVWTQTNRNYIRTWTAETSQTYGESSTTIGKKIDSKIVATATAIFHNEDPIAESFYVEEESGVTLESLDIYFAAKDPSVGVEVFIVECENGYPGQTVVPFSRVFVASSNVNVTPKDSVGKTTPPAPTNFRFPVPLQLQGGMEYAFVVIASSYNYEIYTSTLGACDLVTGNGVREQPYIGTMFKSQNLRTWAAEPMSDISFKLYKYKFKTNTEVYADFVLDDLVATNTGLATTLPTEKGTKEETGTIASFRANSMTISAGTFIPSGTSISWKWYTGHDPEKGKQFENKQDIFIDEEDGLPMFFCFTDNSLLNTNSSLYVRATLMTTNENIAPQIDLEDFCGIFTRNKFDRDTVQVIDGFNYYNTGTYVSSMIALKDPAIGLKVAIDAMLPKRSLLKAYYKAHGASSRIETINSPGMAPEDIAINYGSSSSDTDDVVLPGAKLADIDSVIGKRCYAWYYGYDIKSESAKFILPYQFAYPDLSTVNYSHTSGIPEWPVVQKSTKETNGEVASSSEYQSKRLVMKDPVSLNILETPTATYSENSASGRTICSYSTGTGNNSNFIIYGIYLIPADEGSGNLPPVFVPETVINSTISGIKGITCKAYDPNYQYADNEICLYEGEFWKCVIGGYSNTSPAANVLVWEKIPCALISSGLTTEESAKDMWIELEQDAYRPSTERETSFMEYAYNTSSAMETNEFDAFTIKIEMLAQNSKDIPRFRNLRAVAVY